MSKKIIIALVAMTVIFTVWLAVKDWSENGPEKLSPLPVSAVNTNKDEKLSGNYNWVKIIGADQAKYKNAVWQAINSTALAGFPSAMSATEKATEQCQGFAETALRHEGCMCQTAYWVETVKNGQSEKIDAEAKLKNILSPIDSAAKAVSLVVLTRGDLQINQGIPAGHALAISDGFLVQVVENNSCGCSVHLPGGVIYKVTKSGVVTPAAAEIVPPGEGPEVCVD